MTISMFSPRASRFNGSRASSRQILRAKRSEAGAMDPAVLPVNLRRSSMTKMSDLDAAIRPLEDVLGAVLERLFQGGHFEIVDDGIQGCSH